MKFGRLFLFSVFLTFLAGAVHAAEWLVERATSNVSVSVDGQSWRTVKAGDEIPNAHWVRTGSRARVVLAKGTERIMFRGNTLAAISVSQPKGQKTKVTQRRGSVLLAVKKRRTQHTSVVTPHLAAVVKGTVFEVTVDRGQSTVRVDRGLVGVSNEQGSVDVAPGQQATAVAGAAGIAVAEATQTSLNANGTISMELNDITDDMREQAKLEKEKNKKDKDKKDKGSKDKDKSKSNNSGGSKSKDK